MFVELFKALKRRDVLPDFSSVIDPDSLDNEVRTSKASNNEFRLNLSRVLSRKLQKLNRST